MRRAYNCIILCYKGLSTASSQLWSDLSFSMFRQKLTALLFYAVLSNFSVLLRCYIITVYVCMYR